MLAYGAAVAPMLFLKLWALGLKLWPLGVLLQPFIIFKTPASWGDKSASQQTEDQFSFQREKEKYKYLNILPIPYFSSPLSLGTDIGLKQGRTFFSKVNMLKIYFHMSRKLQIINSSTLVSAKIVRALNLFI